MLVVHSQSVCDVCLDPYSFEPESEPRTPWAIPCGHTFCRECLLRTTPSHCPLCRKSYNPDRIKRLHVDRPSDPPVDDTAREETNWQEQVALAVNASGDDWKSVVSGALQWLRDKPEEAHHALRAAITTLERYKEMSAKRREDRYMIHEWEARAKRRFAEYNVEADKAKVVEENLLREVDLYKRQLNYWESYYPEYAEKVRARVLREMGTPPAPYATASPVTAYIPAASTTTPSKTHASTSSMSNPLPRPPQPVTFSGEESMRAQMSDRWKGSAYSLKHIPPLPSAAPGQSQLPSTAGAHFVAGARNPEGIHPARPSEFDNPQYDDDLEYQPGTPTPVHRSRSRGRREYSGERRRHHRREGETEEEYQERKRRHRSRRRRHERTVDEYADRYVPTSENILGIHSSTTGQDTYGLGSSTTGVSMVAGPSQAGPSSLGLFHTPATHLVQSPPHFTATEAAAAPPLTRRPPSRPVVPPSSTAPLAHHQTPHDSINSWGTVSTMPNLLNFPTIPPFSDGAGQHTTTAAGARVPGATTRGRTMSMVSALDLPLQGPGTATDPHRPQPSRHFSVPSTSDPVSQPLVPPPRPTSTIGVPLSRSYPQSHTPRVAEPHFPGAHASQVSQLPSPWMQSGGVSQAYPAGWPYAPVPRLFTMAVPHVSVQNLQSSVSVADSR